MSENPNLPADQDDDVEAHRRHARDMGAAPVSDSRWTTGGEDVQAHLAATEDSVLESDQQIDTSIGFPARR